MSILIWTALERCQNDGNVPDLTLILAFYHAPYFAFYHTFSRQNTCLTCVVPTLNQHLQRPRATWEQARVMYTHGMIRKYTHTHMHATEATFTQYISKDVSFVKEKGPTIFYRPATYRYIALSGSFWNVFAQYLMVFIKYSSTCLSLK